MAIDENVVAESVNGAADPDVVAALEAKIEELESTLRRQRKAAKRLVRRESREDELKPYQVELLKLQRHLEAHDKRMIVLFEGRDAAGKGGTIRRVTRYMNEKHYRVVALGKPTEEQRSQWYLQRYVAEFPHGAARWSSLTAVGTTAPWSSPSSGSAPRRSTPTSCAACRRL